MARRLICGVVSVKSLSHITANPTDHHGWYTFGHGQSVFQNAEEMEQFAGSVRKIAESRGNFGVAAVTE